MFPDIQYVRITQFMSAPIRFCIIYIAVVFYGCCIDIYLNVELNQCPNAERNWIYSLSIIEIKKDHGHNSCKFRYSFAFKWRLQLWITLGSCQFVTWDTNNIFIQSVYVQSNFYRNCFCLFWNNWRVRCEDLTNLNSSSFG